MRITKPSYCVWIASLPNNPTWQCLNEAAESIFFSLVKLGHGAYVYTGYTPPPMEHDQLIIFNAQVVHPSVELPSDTIIFNAEQIPITDGKNWHNWEYYLSRLRNHTVWDYSHVNRDRLRERGIQSVICPIGYYEKSERIAKTDQDIDVLFYGSQNTRRLKILEECEKLGLKIKALFGVYGEERDDVIGRSKVIVNIHFYPNPIWEIFRCSYLISNRKCIVSENGGVDSELEQLASETTRLVPYERIASECLRIVQDKSYDRTGYDIFKKRDQVEYVKAALKASRLHISESEEQRSAVHG